MISEQEKIDQEIEELSIALSNFLDGHALNVVVPSLLNNIHYIAYQFLKMEDKEKVEILLSYMNEVALSIQELIEEYEDEQSHSEIQTH